VEYRFSYAGKTYRVNVEAAVESWLVNIDDGEPLEVKLLSSSPNCLSFSIGGRPITAYALQGDGLRYISIGGQSFSFELERSRARRAPGIAAQGGGDVISSPMPGFLVKVLVSNGERVEVGQTLAIVEAMKMENELKSPIKGVVKRVNFAEGNQVDALQPIIELRPI